MNQELVSIIVPCFNQAEYLNTTLESVINQIFPNWECIIVSDGSHDNTEEVANQWCKKDQRFQYISQENGGLSSARNKGISVAKGTFILPLDADDKISANYIDLAIQEFSKNDMLKVVYCNAEFFGEKSGKWHLKPYSFEALLRYNMIFCSAIFRKEDWQKTGGYDQNMKYGLEDWEFWIHVLKSGGEVKKLDILGFFYRVKTKSMIKSMTDEQVSYSENYVLNKHKDAYDKAYDSLLNENKQMKSQLRSRKFSINLLAKRFFGFKIFKN